VRFAPDSRRRSEPRARAGAEGPKGCRDDKGERARTARLLEVKIVHFAQRVRRITVKLDFVIGRRRRRVRTVRIGHEVKLKVETGEIADFQNPVCFDEARKRAVEVEPRVPAVYERERPLLENLNSSNVLARADGATAAKAIPEANSEAAAERFIAGRQLRRRDTRQFPLHQ